MYVFGFSDFAAALRLLLHRDRSETVRLGDRDLNRLGDDSGLR